MQSIVKVIFLKLFILAESDDPLAGIQDVSVDIAIEQKQTQKQTQTSTPSNNKKSLPGKTPAKSQAPTPQSAGRSTRSSRKWNNFRQLRK